MQAEKIVHTAVELGYHSCGIIKVEDVLDYADRLAERIQRTPENAEKCAELYRFVRLQEDYPWAKSIVVCVRQYGKYAIPPHLQGLIGKYYLTDGRTDARSADFQASMVFEQYLVSLGLRAQAERKFGITALRWAAHKAGLGMIRRNNFFYADCGSWVHLEAWLIDRALVFKQVPTQKPCPPQCRRCIDACPTKSLREPYTMSRASCISCLTTWDGDDCLTTWDGDDLIGEPHNRHMGSWIYGCDACQDACPQNRQAWQAAAEYPGLSELAAMLGLAEIVQMDYETLQQVIQPKFWYIGADRVWKWKVNALNAMRNAYRPEYAQAIRAACGDAHENVRKTARWVMASLGISELALSQQGE